MNPFTYSHIEFQSGKFDLPARIFSAIQNFLYFLNLTNDNRELIPEFYFNYEFLLNLNYNDFGLIKNENESYRLHNIITNENETFLEFIIELRKQLELFDVTPWIDNIFGSKQFNNSEEQPNSFPKYSYEEYNEINEILKNELLPLDKKVEEIHSKIQFLKFGIVPQKLFNSPHQNIINEIEEGINNFDKKKTIKSNRNN